MIKAVITLLFSCFSLTAGAQVYSFYKPQKTWTYKVDTTRFSDHQCPDTTKCVILTWNEYLRHPGGGYTVYADSCYIIRHRSTQKLVRIANGSVVPFNRILFIK